MCSRFELTSLKELLVEGFSHYFGVLADFGNKHLLDGDISSTVTICTDVPQNQSSAKCALAKNNVRDI